MHRNRSVNTHQFAMVPKADIPRSSFRMQKTYKSTFDAGYLIPFHLAEMLPGDRFSTRATLFARLATPIVPIMDNLYLDTQFFFCPNRLVWNNWVKFMGEQTDPGDSIDYVIPVQVKNAGYAVNSIYDYMGLPTVGMTFGAEDWEHSVLPLRMYNLIWNEWYRDQNLQDSVPVDKTDGPDPYLYTLLRRGKRHDYFTSALPFVQKGPPVTIGIAGTAPVLGYPPDGVTAAGSPTFTDDTGTKGPSQLIERVGLNVQMDPSLGGLPEHLYWSDPQLYADLSVASGVTINQLRLSFQIQKLLERDARGGTRYTEIVRAHFGVISPDARLQRPEYIGGGRQVIAINPIAQTSATDIDGSTTPAGTLAAYGQSVGNHGFTYSATEHGYVIGLLSVRADLTYQQGLARHWSRQTRYDFYFPAFAMLGEQAILNKEIYLAGETSDNEVFGYQERWAEYRYDPSQITGYFRSTAATTLDIWHLSQRFNTLPVLNETFIEENPPIDRIVAVEAEANGKQFLLDAFIDTRAARPLPMYSVPGLVDHF